MQIKKIFHNKIIKYLLFTIFAGIAGFFLTENVSIESNIGKSISEINPQISQDTGWIDKLIYITGSLIMNPGGWENWKKNLQDSQMLNMRIYTMTYDEAIKTIEKIAQRGKVRIILENKKYQEFDKNAAEKIENLKSKGMEIRSDDAMGTNYIHAKTLITDKKRTIQTFNLTHSSFSKNREFGVRSENKDIMDNLKMLFEKDRNGQKIQENDIHPNLLFCPINCRNKIEYLIKNATKSIKIYNQYISDNGVIKAISDNKNAQKMILLPDLPDNRVTKKLRPNILKILKKPYIHAKILLIDDKFLILSSINLSSNSINANREIGIILTDKAMIKQFNNIFIQDRKTAK